jgi:rubrerythrin
VIKELLMPKVPAAVQFIEIAREHHAAITAKVSSPAEAGRKYLFCEGCGYSTEHTECGPESHTTDRTERWKCSLCGLIKSFTVK